VKTKTFRNHVIIVTGASSGIGKALSLQLANEGASLSLAARDTERLDALVKECHNRGGSAIAIPTDVSDEQNCQTLIEQTIRHFGRIDMLVNNAGFSVAAEFAGLPNLELFKRVMAVNFTGQVQCTYYALPYLKDTGGRVVNVSSLGGKFTIPYNTSYIASKHAVTGFSDSLRMELSKSGVSVTVIFPYWVVTEFHERLLDKDGKPRGQAGRAMYTEKMMTADECAEIIIKAAKQRKREVLMWPGPVASWLKVIAPGLLDRIVMDKVFRPIVERAKQGDR
jgi:short-subunit dehydrogenase